MLEMMQRRKIFTLFKVTDCYFEMTDFRRLTSGTALVITNTAD